ncbi:annexin A7 [Trichonephila inaurata madagascariensis]|uniref:Annexin n=1 Tax=Trichonephila inaurata madagascariensis TaxID=2747483 RepID=A0A8X6YNW9_9ARAC|nr:annexin A7 [Trichonephila inaurata madagascariensis]
MIPVFLPFRVTVGESRLKEFLLQGAPKTIIMSNWNRYTPDFNPPPGIPKGYPGALNPNLPPSNPMHPFPASNYPLTSSANPPSNPQYPGANPSPYPSGSYPAAGHSPYPSGSSPYPGAGSSPYPGAGSSPYPGAGSSPYPGAGSSPYSQYSSQPHLREKTFPVTWRFRCPINFAELSSGVWKLSAVSDSGLLLYPSRNYPPGIQQRMAYYIAGEGTVKPYPSFDPKVDAEMLRKAMKGFGTDEKAIIKVLANRSNEQRVYIGIAFKQLYGKDLIEDLKSELSGNFERVILALMMPTHDYLASQIHKAISGLGTDEDVLIEVLCSRTNQEIWAINEAYTRLYGKSMEEDIKSDTSGHFERLLVSACTGARSEDPADSSRAKETAQALYEAGVGQWGTDESAFNAILVSESFQQLAHTFYEYQKLAGHTVAEAIDKEMSGDLKQGFLAIAKCVENRPFYFAEKLYKAMKVGLGTDDDTLIRIVVSRCEIDMVQIKAEYERNYGKPLVEAVVDDTSGDYKRVLIALIEPY